MGYVRIEASRAGRLGGYVRMTFGTIDDVMDARANGPHAEGGQRSGNPPTPRARNVEKLTEMGKKERKRSAKVLLFAYMLAYMK
jgi:hypothetical protein